MASENEKCEMLADILAEIFDFSDKRIEEGRDHAMTSESVGLIVHQLAKRLEAAWKRESAGNAAATREALLRCEAISCLPEIREQQCVRDMRNIIAAALSAPPRQCDIGTAEEQYERYRHRCNAQDCCYCPVRKRWDFSRTGSESCQLVWAQMPYGVEEGGAK